jgi:hypothetical protein
MNANTSSVASFPCKQSGQFSLGKYQTLRQLSVKNGHYHSEDLETDANWKRYSTHDDVISSISIVHFHANSLRLLFADYFSRGGLDSNDMVVPLLIVLSKHETRDNTITA